jgi:hypothetical protein
VDDDSDDDDDDDDDDGVVVVVVMMLLLLLLLLLNDGGDDDDDDDDDDGVAGGLPSLCDHGVPARLEASQCQPAALCYARHRLDQPDGDVRAVLPLRSPHVSSYHLFA